MESIENETEFYHPNSGPRWFAASSSFARFASSSSSSLSASARTTPGRLPNGYRTVGNLLRNKFRLTHTVLLFGLPSLPLEFRVVVVLIVDAVYTTAKLCYWLYYNFFFNMVDSLIDLVMVFDVARVLCGGICAHKIASFSLTFTDTPRSFLKLYFLQYVGMALWNFVWITGLLASDDFCLATMETPLVELLLRKLLHPTISSLSESWKRTQLSERQCNDLRLAVLIGVVVSLFFGIYFVYCLALYIHVLTKWLLTHASADSSSRHSVGRSSSERRTGAWRPPVPLTQKGGRGAGGGAGGGGGRRDRRYSRFIEDRQEAQAEVELVPKVAGQRRDSSSSSS